VILDLPFPEADRAALDAGLAAVDRELDALFLEEVAVTLIRLDAERETAERAERRTA
jgi:hypothetical protein